MDYNKFHKSTSVQKIVIKEDNFTYRLLLAELNKHINSKDKILDIGCGAGTLCLYFGKKGNKVLGIDVSEKAIREAEKSAKLLNLVNVNFKTINFPKNIPQGKFDFVVFTEVIEHIKDDDLAIKKIYSMMNPGGILFISTPSANAPLHKMGYTKGFDQRVGHVRRYKTKELVGMLEKNNFKTLKTKEIEGVARNFLFINPYAGILVRVLNRFSFASNTATFIDNISLNLFGNSNIIIVAKKK